MSVPFVRMILRGFLLLVNLLSLALYGWDKYCAKKRRRRIPEAVLLSVAAIGGAAGALVGMFAFHHKTNKLKFNLTVPLLLVLQIFILLTLSMGL